MKNFCKRRQRRRKSNIDPADFLNGYYNVLNYTTCIINIPFSCALFSPSGTGSSTFAVRFCGNTEFSVVMLDSKSELNKN